MLTRKGDSLVDLFDEVIKVNQILLTKNLLVIIKGDPLKFLPEYKAKSYPKIAKKWSHQGVH